MTCHTCTKCGDTKDEEGFPIDRRSKTGRAGKCKACKRKHYEENKEAIQKSNNKWYARNKDAKRIASARARRVNLGLWKEHMPWGGKLECSVCGYDEHFAALDFHHVAESKKEHHICDLLVRKPTLERIKVFKEEIAKCVILCANCHRVHHAGGNRDADI